MILRKFLASSATALVTLAAVAVPVLAAIGNQNPNLTVELTLNPAVVTAGDEVTVYAAITNNTKKTKKVVAELEVTSPSGVTDSYYEKYVIRGGKTVSETILYTVPADAEAGVYTVTLYASEKKGGASWATEYVTVQ